jgi:magnesium-transporting ATPase (P-type)
MTVRAAATASGRAELTGHGWDPAGELRVAGRPLSEPAQAEEVRRLLGAGVLANNAVLRREEGTWEVRGDPAEGALKVAARKAGLEEAGLEARRGHRHGLR